MVTFKNIILDMAPTHCCPLCRTDLVRYPRPKKGKNGKDFPLEEETLAELMLPVKKGVEGTLSVLDFRACHS